MNNENNDIENAFKYIHAELELDTIKKSLGVNLREAQKSHDSIHQLLLLTAKLIPNLPDYSFKTNSTFIVYQWEAFYLANRANIEALASFYNSAFIQLRITLELIIKGTLFECIAHKEYRNNFVTLKNNDQFKNLIKFLNQQIKEESNLETDLENISITIFDITSDYIRKKYSLPSIKNMIKQLVEWKLFDGLPDPENYVYNIYEKLSLDVHVHPDNIDIGRILIMEKPLFKGRMILSKSLLEFFSTLHVIMDISMVITLNLFKNNIDNIEVRKNLEDLLIDESFLSLDLKNTKNRLVQLVGAKSIG